MAIFYTVLWINIISLGDIVKCLPGDMKCILNISKNTKFDIRLEYIKSIANRDRTSQEMMLRKQSTDVVLKDMLHVNAYAIISTILDSSDSSYITDESVELMCHIHEVSPICKSAISTNGDAVMQLSSMFKTGEYSEKLTTLGMNPKHILNINSTIKVASSGGSIMYPINAGFIMIEATNSRLIFAKVKEAVSRYGFRNKDSTVICMMYNNNPSSAIIIPVKTNIYNMLNDHGFFESLHTIIQ